MSPFIKPTSGSTRFKNLLAQLPPLQIPLDNRTQQLPKFSDLPKEIRIKIWKIIAHQRRSIKLVADTLQLHADHKSHRIPHQRRVPAILHICQESREEGLLYYEPCLEYTPWDVGLSTNDAPWFSATYFNTIYVCIQGLLSHAIQANAEIFQVNFAVDRFYFRHSHDTNNDDHKINLQHYNFARNTLAKIQYLEINSYHGPQEVYRHHSLLRIMLNVNILTVTIDISDQKHATENVNGHLFLHDCKHEFQQQMKETAKRADGHKSSGPLVKLINRQAVQFKWKGWATVELTPTCFILSFRSFFQSRIAGQHLGDWETVLVDD